MTNESNKQPADTLHCWSCKKEIGLADTFCPHCGTRLMFEASADFQAGQKPNERAAGVHGTNDFSTQARSALTEWRKINPALAWGGGAALLVCVLIYIFVFSSGGATPDLRVEKSPGFLVVTNIGQAPITIQRVYINGNEIGMPSNISQCSYSLSEFPRTLQIGNKMPFIYLCIGSEIIEATIHTDHGTATYKW
jgi:hypothetical protein